MTKKNKGYLILMSDDHCERSFDFQKLKQSNKIVKALFSYYRNDLIDLNIKYTEDQNRIFVLLQ